MFKLPDVQGFYRSASARLAGELVCRKCGQRRSCASEDAAGYLARGWPECCGHTMELVTAAQLRERGRRP